MTLEEKLKKDCQHAYVRLVGTQKADIPKGQIWEYNVLNMYECVNCKTSILDEKQEYKPTIYKKNG